MILFYNYYFRFNSKQVFECFFFPFALLQNYAYSQVEQCVRFVVGDKKTNKAISLLINNIALFDLLKDVYLCGRSVILCGHFTDFAFSMAFSIALTNWALVSPVPELRASL